MARRVTEIGLSVKRLQWRHHRAANAALTPLGLSLVQWDALRHLHRNPGASLHDLAQLTFQTDQSFGSLANRMIARGLIEPVPGPGRARRHRLTQRGDDLRKQGQERMDGLMEESFAGLSDEELATFDELLRKVLHHRTE